MVVVFGSGQVVVLFDIFVLIHLSQSLTITHVVTFLDCSVFTLIIGFVLGSLYS